MPEVDYDALPGYELQLIRPQQHDGVRYSKATLLYLDHQRDLWVACLRPRREVQPHRALVRDPVTGQNAIEWIEAHVEEELRTSFPHYLFRDDAWRGLFKALPMRPTQMEGFASALNSGLADVARARRAMPSARRLLLHDESGQP